MNREAITAIIPAKGISGRLPHKNTLPFGESNLLLHKIRQLKQVRFIKEIIVSSEDEEILNFARKEKVRAVRRPLEYSTETKPFQDFLFYIVGEAKYEHIMWACCTSPLVDPDIYNRACLTYFQKLKEGYDSLITVMEYRHYLLDANMNPLTFSWGPGHRNSQELNKLYFFTDGIQLAPKSSMQNWRYYFGHKPYDQKSSTDIDTIYDYLLGRIQYYLDEEDMKNKGIALNDGEAVYQYALHRMIQDIGEPRK